MHFFKRKYQHVSTHQCTRPLPHCGSRAVGTRDNAHAGTRWRTPLPQRTPGASEPLIFSHRRRCLICPWFRWLLFMVYTYLGAELIPSPFITFHHFSMFFIGFPVFSLIFQVFLASSCFFFSRMRSEGSRFTWGSGGEAVFAKSCVCDRNRRQVFATVRNRPLVRRKALHSGERVWSGPESVSS